MKESLSDAWIYDKRRWVNGVIEPLAQHASLINDAIVLRSHSNKNSFYGFCYRLCGIDLFCYRLGVLGVQRSSCQREKCMVAATTKIPRWDLDTKKASTPPHVSTQKVMCKWYWASYAKHPKILVVILVNSATHISEYLKQNPSFNIVNIIVTSNGKGIELVDCCIPYIYQQQ